LLARNTSNAPKDNNLNLNKLKYNDNSALGMIKLDREKYTDPIGLRKRSAMWNKNIRRIKVSPELCGYWISTTAEVPFFHILVFSIATRIPESS